MSEKIGAGGKYQEFNTANGQYEKESKGENTAIEDTDFFSGEEKGEAKEDFFEEKAEEIVNKTVKVDLSSDIQKQFDNATPKERQKIAYRYIMYNLCGEYSAPDGRVITISSVGADKITHRDIEVKLRVSPSLAQLIKAGQFQGIKEAEEKANPKFVKFAYYKVTFQIGENVYTGLLNVGIRKDGSSTLYDLNPFNKQ